jgi:uncharacterized protein (DUF2336 family)
VNATLNALSSLARVRDPESRAHLALGITEICTASPLSRRAEPLADEILLSLARKAEQRVRMAMATRLADCDWAPHEVIRFLAFDVPAVAEPIIARSSRLTEGDLIRLAIDGTLDHRCLIARRPEISMAVTSELARRTETLVLHALARNSTASLSELACEALIQAAREDEELARLLEARPDLPGVLAAELATDAVQHIEERIRDTFGNASGIETVPGSDVVTSALQDDEDTLASKLIEKLEAAGTLNGTFALRALTQGNDPLFDHAIASLCTLSVSHWRKAMAAGGIRAAALACRAARIDRSVFPTVLRGLQRSGRIHSELGEDAMAAAAKVFSGYTAGTAHDSLRRMADSV